jgi:hypothetical protein
MIAHSALKHHMIVVFICFSYFYRLWCDRLVSGVKMSKKFVIDLEPVELKKSFH